MGDYSVGNCVFLGSWIILAYFCGCVILCFVLFLCCCLCIVLLFLVGSD